ncbi:MAG: hypothetical protein WAO52_18935 [Prolixibacteraceae bacterium]
MENQNIQLPNISQATYDRLDKFIIEPGFVEFAVSNISIPIGLLTYILLRREQLKN